MADHHGTIDWDPIDSYEKLLYGLLGLSATGSALALMSRRYTLMGCSMLLGAGGLMLLQNQHNVPTSPRHVGVMTFWGKRSQVRLLPPGDYFIWKGFPFQTDIINVSMEPRTKDFPIEVPVVLKDGNQARNAAVRAGGDVEVHVQLVYVPDTSTPMKMFQYLDMGGSPDAQVDPADGLITNLKGKISEVVRTTVGRLSWIEAQFKKSELTALLLKRITGEKIHKYRRNAEGTVLRADGSETYIQKEYHPIGEWTAKEILGDTPDKEGLGLDVAVYLDIINDPDNDIADVHGLGIVVKRLNIERVKLLGKLAEDAEGAAREQAQRETRQVEMEGRLDLAQRMVAASAISDGPKRLTLEEAMRILRVEDGKTEEEILRLVVEGVDFGALAKTNPQLLESLARFIPPRGPASPRTPKKGK